MRRFAELIAPYSVAEFFETIWQQRACHFSGHPNRHRELFPDVCSRERVAQLLRSLPDSASRPTNIDIESKAQMPEVFMSIRKAGDVADDQAKRSEEVLTLPVSFRHAADLTQSEFKEGMLTVAAVHRCAEELMDVCSLVRQAINQPGDLHTYLFVHSSQGVGRGLHYDSDDTFFIQLDGIRRFRVSESSVKPHAPFAARRQPDGRWMGVMTGQEARLSVNPDNVPINEYTLVPGDALYFPSGFMHQTWSPEGGSIGVAISITTTPQSRLIAELVKRHVDTQEQPWRTTVPRNFEGELTPVASRVAEHFTMLASEFGDVENGARTLRREITTLVAQPTGTLLKEVQSEGVLDATSRLRCHPCHLFLIDESERPERVVLYIDNHELEFEETRMQPLATFIANHRAFSVDECLQSAEPAYSFDEVRETLEALLELGCLVFDRRSPEDA